MEKTIGVAEIGQSFGQVLQQIEAKGDKFVIERNGQPVAVIVPLEIYEEWKRHREAFFAKVREIQERIDLSPEEADLLAEEAVKAVREASFLLC
jgi:prevent-host-death family protein